METKVRPAPGIEMSPEAYERFALEEAGRGWEFVDGRLREKPPMSIGHEDFTFDLAVFWRNSLPRDRYLVRHNAARLKRVDQSYFIPVVAVIPVPGPSDAPFDRRSLDLYIAPVLLVVEAWSPSTGGYDLAVEIRAYQDRGDLEIWRLHPFDRYVIAWRRQPDGSCTEQTIHGGKLTPVGLPEVTVNLDDYFI